MTTPSKGSRDPAIAVAVAKAVPQLVNYNFPDPGIAALRSGFLRNIYPFRQSSKIPLRSPPVVECPIVGPSLLGREQRAEVLLPVLIANQGP